MSQEAFAEALGCTKGSVFNLESGRTRSLQLTALRNLKEKFGVDAAALLSGTLPDLSRFEALAATAGQDLQAVLDAAAEAWAKMQAKGDVVGKIVPAGTPPPVHKVGPPNITKHKAAASRPKTSQDGAGGASEGHTPEGQ